MKLQNSFQLTHEFKEMVLDGRFDLSDFITYEIEFNRETINIRGYTKGVLAMEAIDYVPIPGTTLTLLPRPTVE